MFFRIIYRRPQYFLCNAEFICTYCYVFLLHDRCHGPTIPEVHLVETLFDQFPNGKRTLADPLNEPPLNDLVFILHFRSNLSQFSHINFNCYLENAIIQKDSWYGLVCTVSCFCSCSPISTKLNTHRSRIRRKATVWLSMVQRKR